MGALQVSSGLCLPRVHSQCAMPSCVCVFFCRGPQCAHRGVRYRPARARCDQRDGDEGGQAADRARQRKERGHQVCHIWCKVSFALHVCVCVCVCGVVMKIVYNSTHSTPLAHAHTLTAFMSSGTLPLVTTKVASPSTTWKLSIPRCSASKRTLLSSTASTAWAGSTRATGPRSWPRVAGTAASKYGTPGSRYVVYVLRVYSQE
jgi:hypothetical protein